VVDLTTMIAALIGAGCSMATLYVALRNSRSLESQRRATATIAAMLAHNTGDTRFLESLWDIEVESE